YPKCIGSTREAPVLHCCPVAELIHFVGADLPIHAYYVAIAAVHKFTRRWVSGKLLGGLHRILPGECSDTVELDVVLKVVINAPNIGCRVVGVGSIKAKAAGIDSVPRGNIIRGGITRREKLVQCG